MITYSGSDKWKQRATQLLNSGSGLSPFSLSERKFIFIGDSYQEGWTEVSGSTIPKIDSWLDYFISWYGEEMSGYYRNQAGGWGFAKTNCQFITLLQNLASSISDKTSITDIVVQGGYNDYGYVSGVIQAIADFMTYCKTTYPNAKVWIAPLDWTTNSNQSLVISAEQNYIDGGQRYGANICNNIKWYLRNHEEYLSSDEVHPNATGYQALARCMHNCLCTGSCEIDALGGAT